MLPRSPRPEDLVHTQAETVPPPDVTVPEPNRRDFDPDILAEVERLARRVGGPEKLRELTDALIRFQR